MNPSTTSIRDSLNIVPQNNKDNNRAYTSPKNAYRI